MGPEIAFMNAVELGSKIRRRDLSPVEVVNFFLDRINERNPEINAFVTMVSEEAMQRAKSAERALMSGGSLGPLHGIPVAIKDLFTFKPGIRATSGSAPLKDYQTDMTSSYVADIEQAGGIVLGLTNSPEFGHKGATDNYIFGPTSTPFDLTRNSGGSSGGSAAAVAAGLVPLSQGSDGGGSIRIPASFSGVYGYKPSYGRVPFITRPNAFTSINPFLFVGPITRTVEDAALLMSVLDKHDPRDPFSLPSGNVNYLEATRKPVSDMKVAYSPDLGIFPVEESVAKVVYKATEAFKELGIEVDQVEIKINRSQQELSGLWVRQMAMLHMELAEMFKPQGIDLLGEHNSMLTPTFAKTLEIGKKMSGWDVRSGELLRSSVYDPIQDILDDYDFIVSPTLSVPPFKNATNGDTLGPTEVNGETVDPTIGWCMTYPINYTGNPAASIPAGFNEDGLPIGMQIIGRRYADENLLAVSAAFERARPWHQSYLDLEEKRNGN